MRYQDHNFRGRKGVTLLEMVMAMAIISVVFASILPIFRNVQAGWDVKQGASEAVQNGRAAMEYLKRYLSSSLKVTAVSDSSDTNGYIEFEDNTSATQRCDLAANNYIQFGPTSSLSELAGPVASLKFTCYALDDMDTPTTDVDTIRFVKVEAEFVNSAANGNNKSFTTSTFLQANRNNTGGEAGSDQVTFEAFTEAKVSSNAKSITIPTPDNSSAIKTTTISKETGGSSNFVVDMPVGRPDGDLYIAQIAQEGGANITGIPSGWTEITNRDMSNNIRLATYWKIGSSEPATYTWQGSSSRKWLGAIHRISGADTSNPINASNDSNGNSSNPNAPSVTTSVDNCFILRMYSAEGDEQASSYWPSGTTGIFQDDSSGTVVGAAAYETQGLSGSTGSASFSMTGSKKWVAATIAIEVNPGGSIEGDLLIAAVATDAAEIISPPSGEGWTLIDHGTYSTYVTLGIWWKLAEAAESSTHTFTWTTNERSYGWMMRFSGHDPTTPIHIFASGGGNSNSPDCPSVTTTKDNCMILRIGGFDDDDVNVDNTGLSGYTTITMDESNSGNGTCSAGAGYKEQPSPGSSGVSEFSLTNSEQHRTATIAIAPVSSDELLP